MNQHVYDRHSTVEIPLILELIKERIDACPGQVLTKKLKKQRVPVNDVPVRVDSIRLQTFLLSGIKCHHCGLEASFFAIERDRKSEPGASYHLNLWGVDQEGEELIFTHDHKLARALGGPDNINNTQTLCGACNWKKGELEGLIVEKIIELGKDHPEVVKLKASLHHLTGT